ncbi:unnamed protein product [Linum trigynum]|uniref:Uncharacterized protein n=1 Tax=Linum trigynum TaxID=586398 RepID=A0AAV2F840_9ROSI
MTQPQQVITWCGAGEWRRAIGECATSAGGGKCDRFYVLELRWKTMVDPALEGLSRSDDDGLFFEKGFGEIGEGWVLVEDGDKGN